MKTRRRRILAAATASGLLILVLVLSISARSEVQIIGHLSRRDIDRIKSAVRREVLVDYADWAPNRGRWALIRALPGGLRYWYRHPIKTIDVQGPDRVVALFTNHHIGERMGWEYDYNVVGFHVIRTTNGWRAAGMIVKMF